MIRIQCTVREKHGECWQYATVYPTLEQNATITLLTFTRLCMNCFLFAPSIGPRHDKERHNIGIEYELLLEETLQSMGKQPTLHLFFVTFSFYFNSMVQITTQIFHLKRRQSYACEERQKHQIFCSLVPWVFVFESGMSYHRHRNRRCFATTAQTVPQLGAKATKLESGRNGRRCCFSALVFP